MSSIFREKSLNKVNQPEDLNDYIRVTRPSIWIVLIAMILLLIGIIAWMVFGSIDIHNPDGSVAKEHPITFVTN